MRKQFGDPLDGSFCGIQLSGLLYWIGQHGKGVVALLINAE